MKNLFKIVIFIVFATLVSCEEKMENSNLFFSNQNEVSYANLSMVDPVTDKNVRPIIHSISQTNGVFKASPTTDNWVLIFIDEFDGTAVDTTKWTVDNCYRGSRPEIGIGSWYRKPQNVQVTGGNLLLKVTKETNTMMYVGLIKSINKFEPKYGYYEVRIKVADTNAAATSCFWLQGQNQANVDNSGNDGAEIDIFESSWVEDNTNAVIHIDGYGADKQASSRNYSPTGIHSGYHTFGMWWTKDFINIYYDGTLKAQYTDTKWIPWVKEYLLLSTGAAFGLSGDDFFVNKSLGFLTQAEIDYVRVWQIPDTINLECESITNRVSTTNDAISVVDVSTASGGKFVKLAANSINDNIRFDSIYVPVETLYSISLSGCTWNSYGQYSCMITNNGSWTTFTPTIDFYNSGRTNVAVNFGNITLTAGYHSISFNCIGKNTYSSNYSGSFDKITLTPIY